MIRLALVIIVMVLFVASCGMRRVGTETTTEGETRSTPIYDPLATAQDREVVPEVYPAQVSYVDGAGDSLVKPGDMSFLESDSAASAVDPTEVYRVQIFTSRLYSEAVTERALAEEIFNLMVHLDYEVPYYKLRVGDFGNRDQAEDMLAEIKNIGYRNAWVARVILRVREAPEYELQEEPILPDATTDSLIEPTDSTDRSNGSDDR